MICWYSASRTTIAKGFVQRQSIRTKWASPFQISVKHAPLEKAVAPARPVVLGVPLAQDHRTPQMVPRARYAVPGNTWTKQLTSTTTLANNVQSANTFLTMKLTHRPPNNTANWSTAFLATAVDGTTIKPNRATCALLARFEPMKMPRRLLCIHVKTVRLANTMVFLNLITATNTTKTTTA